MRGALLPGLLKAPVLCRVDVACPGHCQGAWDSAGAALAGEICTVRFIAASAAAVLDFSSD